MVTKEHCGMRACVFHIKPNPVESVTSIAVFWRHDRAVEYADFFGLRVSAFDPDFAWYCQTCGRAVQNEHVTFQETHDVRCGGCGNPIRPLEAP